MNWIGIDNQFNSIQHELNWMILNWNWIGIESRNWSELFNSINSFSIQLLIYNVKHFFVWHIMEIAVWQATPWGLQWLSKQCPHAPLCVPSMGSAGVFGHEGLTITSITLIYLLWFNSLGLGDQQRSSKLITPLWCHIAWENSLMIIW